MKLLSWVIPTSLLKVTCIFPTLPLLVVITITPLPALEPYNAEADAPLTTSKEAMNVLNQYNQGGENLQFIKENGQIFLSETKEDGDNLKKKDPK